MNSLLISALLFFEITKGRHAYHIPDGIIFVTMFLLKILHLQILRKNSDPLKTKYIITFLHYPTVANTSNQR